MGAGCAPSLPNPSILAVSPSWGFNEDITTVQISGHDLYPRVQVSDGDAFEFDRDYRIWLVGPEERELDSVKFGSYELLSGTVAAGLTPGLYDLRMDSPTGFSATLEDAFTVTDTLADRLDLSSSAINYEVNELAVLHIQARDRADEEVGIPLEVTIRVESDLAGSGVGFIAGTLNDQEELSGEVGVRGTLGSNGHGYIALTSEIPDELTVTVESSGDEHSGLITAGTLPLAFEAGTAGSVDIRLPRADFVTEAGRQFEVDLQLLDADGNPADQQSARVTLEEGCAGGTLMETLQFVGSTTVQVQATRATDDSCPENQIIALGSGGLGGESAGFEVRPADVDGYLVVASPRSVVAGEDELHVLVWAVDEWGNPNSDYSTNLELFDDAGGLDPLSNGLQACDPFYDGFAYCSATLWKADEEVVVTVEGEDGLDGVANTIEVSPGAAASVVVDVIDKSVVAGASFEVRVRMLDGYGNAVDADGDSPLIEDGTGELACIHLGTISPLYTESYGCIATRAEDEKRIHATYTTRGVSGTADRITVTNAELATATVDLDGVTEVEAGQALEVSIAGFDIWGNPYLTQSDPTLDLADETGTLSPITVELNASGEATLDLTAQTAMEGDWLTVSHSGSEVGLSSTFDVIPTDLDRFEVDAGSTWAWVDSGFDVRVTAVDRFGNTVTDYADSPTLSSSSALGPDVLLEGFDAGTVTAQFVFDTTGFQDRLVADDGLVTGSSGSLDVLRADCSSPPTADLEVAGTAPTVLCRVGGVSTATSTLDASGSSAGASSLVAWHFDDGTGSWTRSASSSTTAEWTEEGRFLAQALAVDSKGCADLATVTVYVADDDGGAAGPVDVTVQDSTLSAGSATAGTTSVDLGATDCSGDPAAGATLQVRATLGAPGSGTTTLSSTGAGYELTLDANGEAQVDWSMAAEIHGGKGTIYVGRESGIAFGSDTATVTGDAASPTVLFTDPMGTSNATFSEVQVDFSEAIRSSSLTVSRLSLKGPTGVTVPASGVSLDSSSKTATLSLSTSQSAGSGTYTLTASSLIHDVAGNSLSGDYSGSGATFTLSFGAVTDSSKAMSSCTGSVTSFRPDGDSGSGSEADSATFTLKATGTPAWWELEVDDEDGDLVRLDRVAATSASGSWSWDGRGQNGVVVSNGAYTLIARAIDASFNAGTECSKKIQVDNRVAP